MGDSEASENETAVLETFTNKLYHEVPKENNVLISPVIVEMVLAMAYQGAAGETAEKIAKILNVTDKKSAAEKYKRMLEALNTLSHVNLDVANKIYIMKDFPLKSDFKNTLEDSFMSRSDVVDFGNSVKTAAEINDWVENKTSNKIKNLISPDALNAMVRLVLVNALYFKGNWTNPFKPEDTSTEPFFMNDDETIDCEMMFVMDDFKIREYSSKLNASLLELPYKGDEVSMIFILPHEYDGIEELEKDLANVDLSKIMDEEEEAYVEQVEVYLPKFKIEATTDIKPLLEQMGLGEIFEPGVANFSEISESPEPLHVSEIIQKTFIDVNEKGTEAAAAGYCGLMMLSGPKRFTADHPFMFVLQAKGETGNTVLFVGKVYHPIY